MAYPSLSTAVSAQRAASIKKAYIKTGSELYQYLGAIRNGELKITPYETKDTSQRNLTVGSFTVEGKFEMLQTKVGELELIDSIVDGSNSLLLKLTDAGAIPATTPAVTEGWVALSNAQIGIKARYVSDGNPSSVQYVEIMFKGSIIGTSIDAAVKASIADVSFHISTTASETYSDNNGSAGGTIFGYYNSGTADDSDMVPANRKPNGFSSVQLQDANATTYVTIGRVRTGKIIADFVAEEDSLGRYNVYAVDLDVEYECLVSDAATLLFLDTMNVTNTDVKVTLLDGKVFTIASLLGVTVAFENVGDYDKYRIIRFKHRGRIPVSSFDGIVA